MNRARGAPEDGSVLRGNSREKDRPVEDRTRGNELSVVSVVTMKLTMRGGREERTLRSNCGMTEIPENQGTVTPTLKLN